MLAILASVKAREEGRTGPRGAPPPPIGMGPTPRGPTAPTVTAPAVQYNRYDQERFNRQREGKEIRH